MANPPAWMDLNNAAHITVTSASGRQRHAPALPWNAEEPGEQTLEIRFHEPTGVARLHVVFTEPDQSRTQELTVWASLNRGEQHRELVRQQFNFSPGGATRETEDYLLNVAGVSALCLRIVPSIDGRPVVARIDELRISALLGPENPPAAS